MAVAENKKYSSKGALPKSAVVVKPNYLSISDIASFKQGINYQLYKKFGAHLIKHDGVDGAYFVVWAPEAKSVSVMGDFNGWSKRSHVLVPRQDGSGLWEGFIAGVKFKDRYKFYSSSKHRGYQSEKSDPFAFCSEISPNTASIVYSSKYQWQDQKWLSNRKKENFTSKPMSIYEVHLGSWRKGNPGEFKTYCQMADELVPYVKDMGFTHVEFMPLMEHPFYGSWGYQALSYFAPTSRYGTPDELMCLIDRFHQQGIGVILDWVVSHFPNDEYGLANFDGTKLFEQDELHPDWQSCVFNLGKLEIDEFLISSAMFWIENFHIDGLRVDAVASMLYLDYSRKEGEWKPNIFGGRENLEAISFIRQMNETVKKAYPHILMVAEESTAWPNVTKPCVQGGLDFDMKWNMGWMHDTLKYFRRETRTRGKHNDEIAFCLYYAFSENFILSLSHDEVVHEKNSLLSKMPGEDLEKFANLRALYGFMYGHPGKKLLFMGGEFAQWKEWGHDSQLEWDLVQYDRHRQIQEFIRDLNRLYKNEQALYLNDFSSGGFEWLDVGHDQKSIFSFLRKGSNASDDVLVVCNFKNRACRNYTVGIPTGGVWSELLNSDNKKYGGKGSFLNDRLTAKRETWMVRGLRYNMDSSHYVKNYALTFHLPALSVVFLKKQ